MNTSELRQKRAGLIVDMRGFLDMAEQEKRALTAEENQQYLAMETDVDRLLAEIEREERQAARERDVQKFQAPGIPPESNKEGQRAAFQFEQRALQGQPLELEMLRPFADRISPEYHRGFVKWLRTGDVAREIRALQADVDVYGGYLLPSMQFVDGLIKAVDNLVFVRQFATIQAVPNADSLGAASLENDPADPTWTSELGVGSEDSTMSLGRRDLHPHPLAKYIKLSKTLLRKAPAVEGLVRDRLAYKVAVTAENAYLNGDGAGKPLGVFTASDDGIPTGQDVSTGNSTTAIAFDGLIEAKYKLKGQYWPRARWIFHRDAVKQIRKLKDGNGAYIWEPSVVRGAPDQILNMPVMMSEYAPNTFTTGLYVGILGDFSFYWIADALDLTIQRVVELYAASNQDGFFLRLESDGMPVLSEAFARVTLA